MPTFSKVSSAIATLAIFGADARSLRGIGSSCNPDWAVPGCEPGFECHRIYGNGKQNGQCVTGQCFQNMGQYGCTEVTSKDSSGGGCFPSKEACDAHYNPAPETCYPSDNPTCSYTVIDDGTHADGTCWPTRDECLTHAPAPTQQFCFAPKGPHCAGLQQAPGDGCFATMAQCQDAVANQYPHDDDHGDCWMPKPESHIADLSTGAAWCQGNCVAGNEANCQQMCQRCDHPGSGYLGATPARVLHGIGPSCNPDWAVSGCGTSFKCKRIYGNGNQNGQCVRAQNSGPSECYPSDNPTCSYTVIDDGTYADGTCWPTKDECLTHAPPPTQQFCFAPKGPHCAGLQQAPGDGCFATMAQCQTWQADQNHDDEFCFAPMGLNCAALQQAPHSGCFATMAQCEVWQAEQNHHDDHHDGHSECPSGMAAYASTPAPGVCSCGYSWSDANTRGHQVTCA